MNRSNMIARERWQIRSIQVLEMVFEERVAQMKKHGDAMAALPDGTGPDVTWLEPLSNVEATEIQEDFRDDYEDRRADTEGGRYEQLTKMHLVREELAEAFELSGNDPRFVDEILQVAALCVQWVELKLEDREGRYRGYTIRIGSPRGDGRVVQIWKDDDLVERTISIPHAERIIDSWMAAP
jgi:hypothetical protein